MTTTPPPAIANTADFLQALRTDPDFREQARALLLTPELLALPETVARLAEKLDRFIATQEAANETQRQFNEEQRQFNDEQREFNRQCNRRLEILEGKVDRLIGSDLENQVQGKIDSLSHRYFELRRTRVLKSRLINPGPDFYDRLYDALDQNKISDAGVDQILAADIITVGRDSATQATAYLVLEVSHTIDQHDLTRAAERAELLTVVTGAPCRAGVVGIEIPEPRQREAARAGIPLVRLDLE